MKVGVECCAFHYSSMLCFHNMKNRRRSPLNVADQVRCLLLSYWYCVELTSRCLKPMISLFYIILSDHPLCFAQESSVPTLISHCFLFSTPLVLSLYLVLLVCSRVLCYWWYCNSPRLTYSEKVQSPALKNDWEFRAIRDSILSVRL